MLFIQKVETPQTAGWTDENELSSHMTNYKHNNLVADQVSVLQREKNQKFIQLFRSSWVNLWNGFVSGFTLKFSYGCRVRPIDGETTWRMHSWQKSFVESYDIDMEGGTDVYEGINTVF